MIIGLGIGIWNLFDIWNLELGILSGGETNPKCSGENLHNNWILKVKNIWVWREIND